jgi:hypothetical protein
VFKIFSFAYPESLMNLLLSQSAVADVAAELHSFKRELGEFRIGLVEGSLELRGKGGDSEDTAAGGDDLSVFESGAGVEDYYVFGGLIVF